MRILYIILGIISLIASIAITIICLIEGNWIGVVSGSVSAIVSCSLISLAVVMRKTDENSRNIKLLLQNVEIKEQPKEEPAYIENIDDANEIGNEFMRTKEYDKAFSAYKQGANANDAKSMVNLGNCFMCGYGCNVDKNLGFEYYLKAANLNETAALYLVGVCYYNGDGVEKNIDEAKSYLTKAGKAGSQDAITLLDKINKKK